MPNQDGTLGFAFGQSKTSFFRKRDCISVFDFRNTSQELIDDALDKYYFLNPSFANDKPVYLFLSKQCFDNLIPWTKWKEEEAWRDMVVPDVEAGHLGKININLIEQVLQVTIEKPIDPIVEVLRKVMVTKD